uniref:G protein-coupled receptor n=1 Tax=Setaria digitata TaxID=48799 RepID=A0A915PCZ0_9BILA
MRRNRIGKSERAMLIQAALVCGAIEIQAICFYFLPQFAIKLAGEKAEIPTNIFVNCYVTFNNAVLPTASLICVKRIRDDIKHAVAELSHKTVNTTKITKWKPTFSMAFAKAYQNFRAH